MDYVILIVILCILSEILNAKRSTPSLFKAFERLPTSDYKLFRKKIGEVRHLLVITGGGISEEVGLPSYTEHINYWREYNLLKVTSIETFHRNPSVVWEFYHGIRERALKAKPSIGHRVLAELERKMEKAGKKLSILTTNIDSLHQTAGSKNVFEMHGSVLRTECLKCRNVSINRSSPICPALNDREFCTNPFQNYPVIPEHDLPRCKIKGCGGLLRPDIVLYGECLKSKLNQTARELMVDCDFCIVIGSSYNVMPVGLWPYHLAKQGTPIAEFNTEFSKFTENFKFVFRGPCNETLPKALGKKLKFENDT